MRGKLFSTFLAHYASVAPPPRLPFPVPFLVLQHSAHAVRRNKKKQPGKTLFRPFLISSALLSIHNLSPREGELWWYTERKICMLKKKLSDRNDVFRNLISSFFFGCKFIYLYQFIFQCVRILSRTTR